MEKEDNGNRTENRIDDPGVRQHGRDNSQGQYYPGCFGDIPGVSGYSVYRDDERPEDFLQRVRSRRVRDRWITAGGIVGVLLYLGLCAWIIVMVDHHTNYGRCAERCGGGLPSP